MERLFFRSVSVFATWLFVMPKSASSCVKVAVWGRVKYREKRGRRVIIIIKHHGWLHGEKQWENRPS